MKGHQVARLCRMYRIKPRRPGARAVDGGQLRRHQPATESSCAEQLQSYCPEIRAQISLSLMDIPVPASAANIKQELTAIRFRPHKVRSGNSRSFFS